MSLSVVIQAGGQSQRMGKNKALMPFLGQPLIERVVQRVKPIAAELILNTNQPEHFIFLGLPLVADLIPGNGPLGGLYTALSVAHYAAVAVIACDMPFVNAALLESEWSILAGGDWDVVIPRSDDGLEPLHGLYRKETCLPAIRRALDENRLRMVSWLGDVKVREMSLEEVLLADPDKRAFMNVNTPEEFKQAELLERPSE
jgi:molybdopterin-guanine dinucleotide biosynthesis protein A